jgi:hypothetical protein
MMVMRPIISVKRAAVLKSKPVKCCIQEGVKWTLPVVGELKKDALHISICENPNVAKA